MPTRQPSGERIKVNIRDVFSLFEGNAARRWLGIFSATRPGAAAEPSVPGGGVAETVAEPPRFAEEAPPDIVISSADGLVACPDPEIEALNLQISALQEKIADLSARRVEMEQLIQHFEYRQYRVLGDRLAENLRLRHEYLRLLARRSGSSADREAEEEAAADQEAYRRLREEKAQMPPALAESDRDELKRLYRAAAMRCHPDRVAPPDKAAAHDFFLRIQDAYRQNDLDGLRLIHRQLAEGSSLEEEAPQQNDGQRLLEVIAGLHSQAADILLAIQTLQLDDVYRRAIRNDNWDAYFASVRELLDAESFNLKEKIRRFTPS
ncbi:MAG: heat shock protein DnaJ domain protein [Rhodocyclaceae bacterium]|nr:heat shock protein DnaJ domain protein [Rhodocyclaceae bacterium]